MNVDVRELNRQVEAESAFVEQMTAAVAKVIVGQRYMIERILIGLLTGGHLLLEGVPGLAKTLAVKSTAQAIELRFSRIQFTPDLLPADLTGTLIYNQQTGGFAVRKGPIFANIVLADEINRAPAKVQSALLEAMQELQVTIGDETHKLPLPFFVLATQNPIEQEGTYPLPEAQVDRFMLKLKVNYPTRGEEREIMERMLAETPPAVSKVVDPSTLLEARKTVNRIYIDEKIKEYILDVITATRDPKSLKMPDMAGWIEYGASPRASIALAQAARANAFLRHRGFVTPEDIKNIGFDVLRHRIIVTYEAEAENITSEDIIRRIFETVPVP
ncbi:MAG: AAA family ATPase [Myxococcota bacterium]